MIVSSDSDVECKLSITIPRHPHWEDGSWLLPIVNLGSHSCIGWRVNIKTTTGPKKEEYFELDKTMPEQPVMIFMTFPEEWQARSFEWWSPMHQQARCPKAKTSAASCVVCRPFLTSGVMTFLEACALTAFGKLKKTALLRIAKLLFPDLDLRASMTLFEILVAMMSIVLKDLNFMQVLELLKQRFQDNEQCLFMRNLLAQDVFDELDRDEKQEAEEEERRDREEEAQRRSFRTEWAAEKANTVPKAPPAKAKGAAKGAAKAAPAPAPPPLRIPDDIPEQYSVKHLAPPGAFIWRANLHRAWAGHLPPYSRCSAPWSVPGGHCQALRMVLRNLWSHYLAERGLTKADCPVENLWQDVATAVSAAAASSEPAAAPPG